MIDNNYYRGFIGKRILCIKTGWDCERESITEGKFYKVKDIIVDITIGKSRVYTFTIIDNDEREIEFRNITSKDDFSYQNYFKLKTIEDSRREKIETLLNV